MGSSSSRNSNVSKRIDVSSAKKALTQNPFATLGQSAMPALLPAEGPATAPSTEPAKNPMKGRLLLRRETKHRGGKTVVVIGGFSSLREFAAQALRELEKTLKQRLGCGGSSDLEKLEIVIQGDRPKEVADLLCELGYQVGGVTS